MICLAQMNDLEEIDKLAVLVIEDMEIANIPQWKLNYPRSKHYFVDITNDALYIYKENDVILGVMTILPENDPPYGTITGWQSDKSIVLHRVLVHPEARKKGIAQKLLDHAIMLAKRDEYESIKIDTHLENFKMRHFLFKNGFKEIGYLQCINRQAYEKLLEE